MNAPGEKQFREYLLGGLTPEEREQIESRMFADDDFADSLRELEADLLDRYTAGTLNEADRARVAVLTGSPAWAGKLAASKWIAKKDAPVSGRTNAWWLGWAAAVIAAVFAGWMVRENGRLRELAAKPVSGMLVASVSLATGTQRDSSERMLAIPASSEVVRVEMPGESGYKDCVLVVEGSGRSITVQVELGGETEVAWVPSAMLSPGHYDFLLKGQRGGAVELLGSYSVRIERK